MKNHIEISDVEQTFATKKGPFCALQGVNLNVNRGEIAGPGPDRAVVLQNHSLLPLLT